MFDVQKTLYSAVQYSLIINILFLTIEYLYSRWNGKTFQGRSGIARGLIKSNDAKMMWSLTPQSLAQTSPIDSVVAYMKRVPGQAAIGK
ncbi:MAG: hypothetical protein BA865_12960 [Desulfobacterales bacterium S5133MH4]|nr:MAG: hypothetical protein BA865_12960 [Desulfobacterales bacterium S5133MH4]